MIYRKSFKSTLLVLLWTVAIFHCAFDKANLHIHQNDNSTKHHHHDHGDLAHKHDFNHQLPDSDSHQESSVDCCHIQAPIRGAGLNFDFASAFKIVLVKIDYNSRNNFQENKLQKPIKRTLDPPHFQKESEMLIDTLHSANPPPLLPIS